MRNLVINDADEEKIINRYRLENIHEEYRYLHCLQDILDTGVVKSDRTGVGTKSIPHASLSYDLSKGFPLLTTKKMAWKVMKVELEGFIKGITSKKWYQDRGCRIWDAWCNPQKVPYGHDEDTKRRMKEEDDLGVIYGAQWRNFNNQGYDQLRVIIDTLKNNPSDRRMVCSAWNPCVLDQVALPSCHYSWCVSVCKDTLNLSYTMRSVDFGCGEPFNQASYALLCHLLAKEAGLKPGIVTAFLNNVHVYNNHIEGLTEQLTRVPYTAPSIKTDKFTSIFDWTYEDTELLNYQSHPKIFLPIAV